MILYYDKQGFHGEQNEDNTRIESSSEERDKLFAEINARTEEDNLYQIVGIVIKNGKLVVSNIPRSIDEQKNILRRLRANRVFPIINRSAFWFNSLTEQQKKDIQD
jgi:altronate dehydratase